MPKNHKKHTSLTHLSLSPPGDCSLLRSLSAGKYFGSPRQIEQNGGHFDDQTALLRSPDTGLGLLPKTYKQDTESRPRGHSQASSHKIQNQEVDIISRSFETGSNIPRS